MRGRLLRSGLRSKRVSEGRSATVEGELSWDGDRSRSVVGSSRCSRTARSDGSPRAAGGQPWANGTSRSLTGVCRSAASRSQGGNLRSRPEVGRRARELGSRPSGSDQEGTDERRGRRCWSSTLARTGRPCRSTMPLVARGSPAAAAAAPPSETGWPSGMAAAVRSHGVSKPGRSVARPRPRRSKRPTRAAAKARALRRCPTQTAAVLSRSVARAPWRRETSTT
jgi:hypothetical protein